MLKEFKEFAMKGNMLDLAVGIVIGAAFGKIIDSLVKDILMPLLGLVTGGVDFVNRFVVLKAGKTGGTYSSWEAATKDEAIVLGYGQFINVLIQFVIVAFALFMIVKVINRMRRKEEAAPTVDPVPSEEEKLLAEIRDLLKAR